MKKFKSIVFLFAIFVIITGCSTSKNEEETNMEVKDNQILSTITGSIVNLETLPKTIELYKQGHFDVNDYTKDDILLYGLNGSFGQESNVDLTAEEIAQLKTRNITNVSSYLSLEDVNREINATFGPVNVEYTSNLGQCPSYLYDESEKKYYINEGCINASEKIVSYVDHVSYSSNLFYADVYAGLIADNKVYNDVNRTKVITTLKDEQSYVIDDNNKNEFKHYTYTFTKNSDGNYVFTSVSSN